MHQFILKYTVKLKNLPSVESLAISLAKRNFSVESLAISLAKRNFSVESLAISIDIRRSFNGSY